jgi:hypothetical protein
MGSLANYLRNGRLSFCITFFSVFALVKKWSYPSYFLYTLSSFAKKLWPIADYTAPFISLTHGQTRRSFVSRGDQPRSPNKKEKHKGFHYSNNPFEVATPQELKDMFRPLSPVGFEPTLVDVQGQPSYPLDEG